MTREQAIAFFRDMNECTYGNLEEVEMAIQALQAQDKADTAYDRGYDRGYDDGFFNYEVCHKCKHFEYDELFLDVTGEEHGTSYCGRQADKEFKMRDATPEEQEAIDKYIKSISKPTGVDFDSLSDSQIIHHLTDKAYSELCLLAEKGREALQAQADGEYISRNNAITSVCQWGTTLERTGTYTITVAEMKQTITDMLCEMPNVAIPRCEEREKGECPFYSG